MLAVEEARQLARAVDDSHYVDAVGADSVELQEIAEKGTVTVTVPIFRIRLNLDCADMCLAAGSLGIRRAGSNERLIVAALEACALACGLCAEECEKHSDMHDHCRICAEHCRRCEKACREAARSIG